MAGSGGASMEPRARPWVLLATQIEEIDMNDTFRRRIGFLLYIVILGIATGAIAAGPKAYVGNFSDSTVSVIDTASGTVIATVPVSTGPHGMAITPDGRIAYVGGEGASTVTA